MSQRFSTTQVVQLMGVMVEEVPCVRQSFICLRNNRIVGKRAIEE